MMKAVVITGATSGIGLAVARELLEKKYGILGIGHRQENTKAVWQQLKEEFPDCFIWYTYGDLMQQSEVKRIAQQLRQVIQDDCQGQLNALINNVGCVRSWYATTQEGYEQQFALNHLAGFLLTHYLLPYLKKGKGKILFTGSASHKHMKMRWNDLMFQRRYHPLLAYKQTKLANLLFATALNERLQGDGVQAYVVDPGLVNTDIGLKETGGLVKAVWKMRKRGGVSARQAASTYRMLCEQLSPAGLYYRFCKQEPYSKYVTKESAERLFSISEELCGISFGEEES